MFYKKINNIIFKSPILVASGTYGYGDEVKDIVNVEKLRDEILNTDLRHLKTSSDSEVILNIFAHALEKNKSLTLTKEQIFEAVDEVHDRIDGAYSVIMMILGHGLVAFRDPNGIRPLIYGSKKDKYMIFIDNNRDTVSLCLFAFVLYQFVNFLY